MIMSKIYQPIVIEMTNEIITDLVETAFFSDYEIQSTEFAKKYLLDKLTEKFILGELWFAATTQHSDRNSPHGRKSRHASLSRRG